MRVKSKITISRKCTFKSETSTPEVNKVVPSNKNGELYKGVVCFMIVDIQQNVPCVVEALPETNIETKW